LPGPEYPVAHGSGAGGQGKKWPKPEKSFREKISKRFLRIPSRFQKFDILVP